MAQITAALVKELRETSGAGMMDCKKALVETDGDVEAAVDWLRKKGLATAAAKKSGRVAAEGLVCGGDQWHEGVPLSRSMPRLTSWHGTKRFKAFVRTCAESGVGYRRRYRSVEGRQFSWQRQYRCRAVDPADRHDRREHEHPAGGQA